MFDFSFSLVAAPGASQNVPARGNFVRYDSVTTGSGDPAIEVKAMGGEGGAFSLRPGQSCKLPTAADGFQIANKNGTVQIVGVLKIGDGEFTDSSVTGTVTVQNSTVSGAHSPAGVAVSNASVVLRAALDVRKYLAVQNQHATATLFVRCDGAAATATPACLRIEPGQTWEPPVVPTGEIRAIMDAATAGDTVHVIEA